MATPRSALAPRWYEGRLAGFDLETTSADPEQARIVQACVVHVGGGEPVQSRVWLVNPGVEIPDEAAKVHGITTALARDGGMDARTAVMLIAGELRVATLAREPLVIMNAAYDLTVLDRELRRHDLPLFDAGIVIDPRVLDKIADDYVGYHRRGKRQLPDLCAHYRAKLDAAHDAAFDAIAAARVAYRIGRVFPHLGNMALADLHDLQRRAYAEQAKSLNEHWISKGDPRRVDNYEWPVRSLP